jgi:ATP phosphoribosyltransferase
VELAPLTGLADRIVDIVETGTTLADNGLEVKDEILKISTVMIANRASYKLRSAVLGPLLDGARAALSG